MTNNEKRIMVFLCGCAMGLLLAAVLLIFHGCKQSPEDYTYPRRAVQVAQLSKWIERAGDPLCFVKYDMIVTSSPPSQVDVMLDGARQAGAGEWADNVTICYKCCLRTVEPFGELVTHGDSHTTALYAAPRDWVYRAAQYSPTHAHEVAVYENKYRGCDWLIRDQHGNAIPTYTSDHVLTDWSSYCPRGLWDGVVRVGTDTFSIGDSHGLTVYEWLAGPMRDNVVLSERFLATYDAFCLDDDPFIGSPSWHVPSTTLYHMRGHATHSMVNRQHYDQACRAAVKMWQYEFAGKLNRRIIMLAQGHGLAPGKDPLFAEHVHANYNGSILPSYGFGGYWPQGDILLGWEQWPKIDETFRLYGAGTHERLDAMQGDDVCFTECLVRRSWRPQKQRQLARESLAHTLMYGAYFHSAFLDDESGIRWGRGEVELFTFPEQEFELGKAVSECTAFTDPAHPGKPLYYRYFQRGKDQFTVAINMHEVAVHGIPAREAVWFEGLWPRMHSEKVVF